MTLEAKSIDQPDDKRDFDHGEVRMVRVGDATIGRAVFSPGWRWSADVKPLVGTSSCELAHTAYVVSGRMRVRMNDGTEAKVSAPATRTTSPRATTPGWSARNRLSSSTSPGRRSWPAAGPRWRATAAASSSGSARAASSTI